MAGRRRRGVWGPGPVCRAAAYLNRFPRPSLSDDIGELSWRGGVQGAVDGTKSRRLRDGARKRWCAGHRRRRFARFLRGRAPVPGIKGPAARRRPLVRAIRPATHRSSRRSRGFRQADAPVTRQGRLLYHGDESRIPRRPQTRSRPIRVRPALPEGVTRGDAPVTVPPGVLAATARGRGLRGGGTARGAPIDSAPSW